MLVESLENAILNLEVIIQKENEFFNEFAFLLMEHNWILSKRKEDASLLYCTYGYRNGRGNSLSVAGPLIFL